MKTKLLLSVMLAAVLAFALTFVGCDTSTPDGGGPTPTQFEGEWWNRNLNDPDEASSFRFTGNDFQFHRGNTSVTGSFTSDDTKITFSYGGQNLILGYTLDTDVKDLEIETGNTTILGGLYGGRRAASSADDFSGTWNCLYAETSGANYTEFSYTFSGTNTSLFTTRHPDIPDIGLSGTFTFNNTKINFSPAIAGTWTGYSAAYYFEGSQTLWIDASPAQHGNMMFVKQ